MRAALSEPELPFSVLCVFGPGGIGKTTLLREYGYIAHEIGIQSVQLDGRHIEAAPDFFLAALGQALSLPPDADVVGHLADRGERLLLLAVSYTHLDVYKRQGLFQPLLQRKTGHRLVLGAPTL